MDNYPTDINEFIGNKPITDKLISWLDSFSTVNVSTIETEKKLSKKTLSIYNKSVCFLTGSNGTGKSTLIKLLLKKYSYNIIEFSATDLRLKNNRLLLQQTLTFKNLLSMMNSSSSINKKLIIIDDYENIGITISDIFKIISDNLKQKNKKPNNDPNIYPVIFIGTSLNKKKPLLKHSIYLNLLPLTITENINLIQNYIKYISPDLYKVNYFTENDISSLLDKTDQNIKRIFKFINLTLSTINPLKAKDTVISIGDEIQHTSKPYTANDNQSIELANIVSNKLNMLDVYHQSGISNSLARLLSLDNSQSMSMICLDIHLEGFHMPFAIHSIYPQLYNNTKHIPIQHLTNIAYLSKFYGILLDFDSYSGYIEIKDIGELLLCWGIKNLLKSSLSVKPFNPLSGIDKGLSRNILRVNANKIPAIKEKAEIQETIKSYKTNKSNNVYTNIDEGQKIYNYNTYVNNVKLLTSINIEQNTLNKTARLPLIEYQIQKNIINIITKTKNIKTQQCWLPHNYMYSTILTNLKNTHQAQASSNNLSQSIEALYRQIHNISN